MRGQPDISLSWTFANHDHGWLAWLTIGLYVLGFALCVRAAIQDRAGRLAWSSLALLLLALGINKPLDVQTFMVQVGRRLAWHAGWFGQRRAIEHALAALLVAGLLLALFVLVRRIANGWRISPSLARCVPGVALLLAYVFVRVMIIGHAIDFAGDRYTMTRLAIPLEPLALAWLCWGLWRVEGRKQLRNGQDNGQKGPGRFTVCAKACIMNAKSAGFDHADRRGSRVMVNDLPAETPTTPLEAILSVNERRADRWTSVEKRLSFLSGYFVLGCALVAVGFLLKVIF